MKEKVSGSNPENGSGMFMSFTSEKIKNGLDFLRNPNLFRDVIILICGAISIIFFYLFFNLSFADYSGYSNITNFFSKIFWSARIESDILFLIGSFIVGKFLIIAADLILGIVSFFISIFYFLLKDGVNLRIRWIILKKEWKRQFLNFLKPEIFEPVSPNNVRDEITYAEIAKVREDIPSISGEMERSIFNLLFLKSFLSIFLFLCIFLNIWFFTLFFIFLILVIQQNRHLNYNEYMIYKMIVKSSLENPMK